jgi:hypothetical protein
MLVWFIINYLVLNVKYENILSQFRQVIFDISKLSPMNTMSIYVVFVFLDRRRFKIENLLRNIEY